MFFPTLKLVIKYRRHPSVAAKKVAYKGGSFSFSTTEKVDVISEIKKLNKGKAIHHDDILVERLKENVNFCLKYICIFNNNGIATSKFFLPVLPKIFEKLISKQLSTFFENIKPKSQCGFRKGYSMRHCLLLMLEKRKLQLIITKLSEPFFKQISQSFKLSNL